MTRHTLDVRVFDYTWKQNRLSKDKEALKNSMLNVIRKKPRMAAGAVSRTFNGRQTLDLPKRLTIYIDIRRPLSAVLLPKDIP
jgi:hypothetical protein